MPPRPDEDVLAFTKSQNPSHKRKANGGAFDDCHISKRPKEGENDDEENGNEETTTRIHGGLKDVQLEQPPKPFDVGLTLQGGDIDPITAMGDFAKFPNEVLDEILGNLLVSENDLRVLFGWSLIFPRGKPNLNVAIMSTCSMLHQQGARVLYGKNTFLYDICDPAVHLLSTTKIWEGIYKTCLIQFNKYGHLIRHAAIHVPSKREGDADVQFMFANAIEKFLPQSNLSKPANLHTLTLKVSALSWPELKVYGYNNNNNKMVPGAKMFVGHGNQIRTALYDLNVQNVRILAQKENKHVFEHVIELNNHHKLKQMDVEDPVQTPEQAHERYRQNRHEHVQARAERAELYNIPQHVQELAVHGHREANMEEPYWKNLGPPSPRRQPVPEYKAAALADDWEETFSMFTHVMANQRLQYRIAKWVDAVNDAKPGPIAEQYIDEEKMAEEDTGLVSVTEND